MNSYVSTVIRRSLVHSVRRRDALNDGILSAADATCFAPPGSQHISASSRQQFVKHWKSIFALLQAGLVAAGRQLLAIELMTFIGWLILSHRFPDWIGSVTDHDPKTISPTKFMPLLAYSFLLTATGCALTYDRLIDVTAEQMRQAAR